MEQPAIEQHQESESGRLQFSSFAAPCVNPCARRMVEPETGVGKRLAKRFQVLVAGIIVAIKAQIRGSVGGGMGLWVGGWNGDRTHHGEDQSNSFHADDVTATTKLRSQAQGCDTFFPDSPHLIEVPPARRSAFSHPSLQKMPGEESSCNRQSVRE